MKSLILLSLTAPLFANIQTGFEDLEPGPLVDAEVDGLRFQAESGHAQVNREQAHYGAQCLHVLGGKDRVVSIHAPKPVRAMQFEAERWTSRDPFSVRCEVLRDKTWQAVWHGDDEVRVGRSFKSQVNFAFDPPADQLRFVVTSPEGSGLLIDDLLLFEPGPVRIAKRTARHVVRPVLIGKEHSPVLEVVLEVRGNEGEFRLDGLHWELVGVEERQVKSTSLRIGRDFRSSEPFTPRLLNEGTTRLWCAVTPGDDVTLEDRWDARVTRIGANGFTVPFGDGDPEGDLRTGVALRDAGDAGVHTYRIPGLARTPKGTLIAAYDLRYESGRDLPGHVDVAVQRSTDGGRTWSAMQVCMDKGEPHNQNGVGDPTVLVDPASGRIFVFALWSQGNRAWNGSGPGMTPEETGQLLVTTSDDDGLTWSPLRNLTPMLKNPEWRLFLQSPGNGIAMKDGTLVLPAQYRAADGLPWSTVCTSKDGGETWAIGTGARENTTECRVVELEPGTLMLNMRDNRGGLRAVRTSKDLGKTWEDHVSHRSVLPEPVCNAGLIRGDDGRLWFMNPAVSKAPRRNMTLRASDDDGKTWPHSLLLFEPTCAGYPCIEAMGDSIGVLYEGGAAAHLIFERVKIEEVIR